MSDPVSTIRNLGPASDTGFARAGITTAQQLRALGAEAGYLQYLNYGGFPHFIGFYALVMGLQGRPWNDCRGKEKAELRKTFDRLKKTAAANPTKEKGRLELEAALDLIGVVKKKP